ncbi:hypothetical protein [Paenibacillus oryzisoli]|uniref:Uncharacterized protein n=1 Tax=Paenibacillus oryzisoli TaxID=1850517 RepID=A0A198A6S7_9BACL|nr:hypothetical protein [Paenibacillus oryzisoli]OAS16688.1 hypothetical protein A8708_07420 [Paenibacillus oryzisoli]
MSKIAVMDSHLASHRELLTGHKIREIIEIVYHISLDDISAKGEGSFLALYPLEIMKHVRQSLGFEPATTDHDSEIMSMTKVEVMDKYLLSYGPTITGAEIRSLVNDIFGVNLTAIATLDNPRLSIFSKGQWILQDPADILSVITGKGDIDVTVCATDYYMNTVGFDQFPSELHDFLLALGFSYHAEMKSYHYSNPTGQSISEAFKGQLMGKLVSVIRDYY